MPALSCLGRMWLQFIYILVIGMSEVASLSDEKRLIKHMLDNYERVGRVGRPVYHSNSTLTVSLGLSLIRLDVDEKEQAVKLNLWQRLRWNDLLLTWNPSDFGDVREVRVPPELIWTPEIAVLNSLDIAETSYQRNVHVTVRANGDVLWTPPSSYKSSCPLDIYLFPFDNQTCRITFLTWSNPLPGLDLQFGDTNVSLFLEDLNHVSTNGSQWEIYEVRRSRELLGMFASLTITLLMRRNLVFSTFILTVPIIFLALFTLVVFLMPPGTNNDKASIGVTIFGSILVLLLIFVGSTPPAVSTFPLLGTFYVFTSVIVVVSVFLSTLVDKLGNRDLWGKQRRVPSSLLSIANRLAKVLWIESIQMKEKEQVPRLMSTCARDVSGDARVWAEEMELGEMRTDDEQPTDEPGPASEGAGRTGSAPGAGKCMPWRPPTGKVIAAEEKTTADWSDLLREFLEENREMREAEKPERELQDKLHVEWVFLSVVVDRILFVVYLTAIGIALVTVYPRP